MNPVEQAVAECLADLLFDIADTKPPKDDKCSLTILATGLVSFRDCLREGMGSLLLYVVLKRVDDPEHLMRHLEELLGVLPDDERQTILEHINKPSMTLDDTAKFLTDLVQQMEISYAEHAKKDETLH